MSFAGKVPAGKCASPAKITINDDNPYEPLPVIFIDSQSTFFPCHSGEGQDRMSARHPELERGANRPGSKRNGQKTPASSKVSGIFRTIT